MMPFMPAELGKFQQATPIMFPKKATTRCDDAKGKYFTMLKIHVVKTDLNIIALAESLALHFEQAAAL